MPLPNEWSGYAQSAGSKWQRLVFHGRSMFAAYHSVKQYQRDRIPASRLALQDQQEK